MDAHRRRSTVDAAQARDLTDRIRRARDVPAGLVLHAFITRAWVALDYPDWGTYCQDVIPFHHCDVSRSRGTAARPEPVAAPSGSGRLSVVTTVEGTFHVQDRRDVPIEATRPPGGDTGVLISRTMVHTTFTGPLTASSISEVTTAVTRVQGSAGYVAVEKVGGTLEGRHGSFVLLHTGLSSRGDTALTITVVPDSGTGELQDMRGTMEVDLVDGHHVYRLSYGR